MKTINYEVMAGEYECSHIADTDGITGFMYGGAAVAILSECWIHGEELRRWHMLRIGGNHAE